MTDYDPSLYDSGGSTTIVTFPRDASRELIRGELHERLGKRDVKSLNRSYLRKTFGVTYFPRFKVAIMPDTSGEQLQLRTLHGSPERRQRLNIPAEPNCGDQQQQALERGARMLAAMGVDDSHSGQGVRVALLDSGVSNHPDLRRVKVRDSVLGSGGEDGNGHGTRSCGLIAGPFHPECEIRYGVAPSVELLSCKVSDARSDCSSDDVLMGLEWAYDRHADIVCLPIGAVLAPGTPPSDAYERFAQIMLEDECLLIASAGEKRVGEPANCRAIMAVGAVGEDFHPSPQSAITRPGEDVVNVFAPGAVVLSASRKNYYGCANGTSAAAAYASGIAALWAEVTGARGQRLWEYVCASVQAPAPSTTPIVHAP